MHSSDPFLVMCFHQHSSLVHLKNTLSQAVCKVPVPSSLHLQNVPWVSDVFSGRSHLFPVFIRVDSGCVDDFRASQLFVSSQVTSAEVPDALQHWFLDTGAVMSRKSQSCSSALFLTVNFLM